MEYIHTNMGDDYLNHSVFTTLKDLKQFYSSLSFGSHRFISGFVKDLFTNINSPIYSSIAGTIDSIELILTKGHINDAISLIRKYDDAVITSIYLALLQDDNRTEFYDHIKSGDLYDIYDNTVNKWVYAIRKDLKATRDKIEADERTKCVNEILAKNSQIIKLRKFCNNNIHYNSLRYFLWNDPNYNEVQANKSKLLDMVNEQLVSVFLFHFANIIVVNPEYLTSSDYVDALDCDCTPIEGSQHWFATYAQEYFNKYVSNNAELATYLKECNFLEIE